MYIRTKKGGARSIFKPSYRTVKRTRNLSNNNNNRVSKKSHSSSELFKIHFNNICQLIITNDYESFKNKLDDYINNSNKPDYKMENMISEDSFLYLKNIVFNNLSFNRASFIDLIRKQYNYLISNEKLKFSGADTRFKKKLKLRFFNDDFDVINDLRMYNNQANYFFRVLLGSGENDSEKDNGNLFSTSLEQLFFTAFKNYDASSGIGQRSCMYHPVFFSVNPFECKQLNEYALKDDCWSPGQIKSCKRGPTIEYKPIVNKIIPLGKEQWDIYIALLLYDNWHDFFKSGQDRDTKIKDIFKPNFKSFTGTEEKNILDMLSLKLPEDSIIKEYLKSFIFRNSSLKSLGNDDTRIFNFIVDYLENNNSGNYSIFKRKTPASKEYRWNNVAFSNNDIFRIMLKNWHRNTTSEKPGRIIVDNECTALSKALKSFLQSSRLKSVRKYKNQVIETDYYDDSVHPQGIPSQTTSGKPVRDLTNNIVTLDDILCCLAPECCFATMLDPGKTCTGCGVRDNQRFGNMAINIYYDENNYFELKLKSTRNVNPAPSVPAGMPPFYSITIDLETTLKVDGNIIFNYSYDSINISSNHENGNPLSQKTCSQAAASAYKRTGDLDDVRKELFKKTIGDVSQELYALATNKCFFANDRPSVARYMFVLKQMIDSNLVPNNIGGGWFSEMNSYMIFSENINENTISNTIIQPVSSNVSVVKSPQYRRRSKRLALK
jgi:hypothetical protein